MRRNVVAAIFGTVLTLGMLGFAGYAVYQTGYNNGLASTASEVVVNQGPYWGGAHFFPPFGFFFGFIFLLFLFGFISRMFFWGRWRGGWYGPRQWENGDTPPMERRLHDWHERAHEGDRPPTGDNPDST